MSKARMSDLDIDDPYYTRNGPTKKTRGGGFEILREEIFEEETKAALAASLHDMGSPAGSGSSG